MEPSKMYARWLHNQAFLRFNAARAAGFLEYETDVETPDGYRDIEILATILGCARCHEEVHCEDDLWDGVCLGCKVKDWEGEYE